MPSLNVGIPTGRVEELFAVAFAPVVALTELIKNSSDACLKTNDTISINIYSKDNMIIIKDNGKGLSEIDIKNLSQIGTSEKMRRNNILSEIGEPYAGNKGLGFLTAFNLCEEILVNTYSQIDKVAYTISWKKGTSHINYKETKKTTPGTEIILKGVTDETISLLTDTEELTKLYLASIRSYTETNTIPNVTIYKDNVPLTIDYVEKLESIYLKNNTRSSSHGYFVSKGVFRYSNDRLTLSYEDNILHKFSFSNVELDLKDLRSLIDFSKKYDIRIPRLRKWHEQYIKYRTDVDDFEGIYYIWRGNKNEFLSCFPYGIRIYLNNYGMYNYLDKNNDWLQHGEISQNIKSTNFKPKNTYGYVHFKLFNEALSRLKISQERNDFYVNIAQKKFMFIMRNFVSGILSQIDITIKNPKPSLFFIQKSSIREVEEGQTIRISDFIKTNLDFGSYEIICDDSVSVEDDGTILVPSIGEYNISFSYDRNYFPCKIIVKSKTPEFFLKRSKITINEGNSFDLRELIRSTKNIELQNIAISSEDAEIKGSIFTSRNGPGEYIVSFTNNDILPISKTVQITVNKTFQSESRKIRRMFPNYISPNVPPKIQEIICGISDAYMRYPILCMIALRTLIEICLREFSHRYIIDIQEDFDEKDTGLDARLNRVLRLAFAPNNTVPDDIKEKYKSNLSGNARKKLSEHLRELNLNTYVHNPEVQARPEEVLRNLKIFKSLLNFTIDSLAV